MRIIAGKYRRRLLLTNPGLVTRPMTDRAKESLFENIEKRMVGKRIADIFSGTGTMGFEALSRGAECITFIEKDRVAIELLRKNVETLNASETTLVWPADVLRCSFRPKGGQADRFSPFGLIFFDPPYQMVSSIKTGSPLWLALRRLARADVSSDDATLVFRVPDRAEFDLPEEWGIDWTLEISNMEIHVCTRRAAAPQAELPSLPEQDA
ncbi:RsmD family RNA methyltransferase [Planctomicrobium sp. SH664]|uniref:RsmD family RNA methyltransferase n=1 Tax=Planctomicrobium sp. SH664 TaxID=3448125 RepID=UPI003F5B418F